MRQNRPLKPWFLIAIGLVLGAGFLVAVLVAIANPTIETLTGLAAVVIPAAVVGIYAGVSAIRKRRR
jgi:uncharacterized membrane protein YozB (DUF420 family)